MPAMETIFIAVLWIFFVFRRFRTIVGIFTFIFCAPKPRRGRTQHLAKTPAQRTKGMNMYYHPGRTSRTLPSNSWPACAPSPQRDNTGLRLRCRVRSYSLYLLRRMGTVHEGCQDDPAFPSAQFCMFIRDRGNSMIDFEQALSWISIFLGCGERSSMATSTKKRSFMDRQDGEPRVIWSGNEQLGITEPTPSKEPATKKTRTMPPTPDRVLVLPTD
ncbi:hypothetical protein LTR10_007082 [Elasticomyces elasticus]|nr:hypothetical protein LTR10_007082 [Elasticomyces elasticus]KAK4978900.1 hypothetical protein LTR42_001400 [Elasticomyces elasticus]